MPSKWPLHALGRDLLRDLERDYRVHGARAIADLRKNEPWSYLRLLQSIVPEEATTADDWFSEISNEELDMLLKLVREALAEQQAKGVT